jgi:hypothetical protein
MSFLEQLPLGRAGMIEFERIPLGPLKPLGLLLGKTARASPPDRFRNRKAAVKPRV